MKNYYEILGVEKNASEKEIKSAYRRLSKQYHPDRQAGKSDEVKKECEEKMKEINEAYSTLSDPQKREEYDNPRMGGFGGGFEDLSEMMRNAFHHMGFGGHSQRAEPKPKGSDIRMNIPLGIHEILNGFETKVHFVRNVRCTHCGGKGGEKKIVCPYCHGQGWIEETRQSRGTIFSSSYPCPHCHGQGFKYEKPCSHCQSTGFENKDEYINIKFDAGVNEGEAFVAMGKGNEASSENGIDGNFYAVPVFNYDREKFNIVYPNIFHKIEVDVIDALLGGDITLDIEGLGKRTVHLKECTKDGESIVLKGQGIPYIDRNNFNFGHSNNGDFILVVSYKTPTKLTDVQRECLKMFKENRK